MPWCWLALTKPQVLLGLQISRHFLPKDLSNEKLGRGWEPAVSAKASSPQRPPILPPSSPTPLKSAKPSNLPNLPGAAGRRRLLCLWSRQRVKGTGKAALWASWSSLPPTLISLPKPNCPDHRESIEAVGMDWGLGPRDGGTRTIIILSNPSLLKIAAIPS